MPVALTSAQQVGTVFDRPSRYLLSAKYDGVRVNVHLFQHIPFAFFTTRNGRLFLVSSLLFELKSTFALDGEYLSTRSECVLFDCIHVNHNTSIAQCQLPERLKMAETMLHRHLSSASEITFSMKIFYDPHDLPNLMINEKVISRPQDGLIFTKKTNTALKSFATTYKWKSEQNLTIDVRLCFDDTDQQLYALYLDTDQKEKRLHNLPIEDMPKDVVDISIFNDHIAEVRIKRAVNDCYSLHFVKCREDKHMPNFINVINDIFLCLKQPITLNMLLTAAKK